MDDLSRVCIHHSGLEEKIDALCQKIDERDRQYHERDVANKDAVRAALASAEKASEKTELALKEYKSSANEWRDTVKDLVSRMITRPDVERELRVIDEKIADLRESRSQITGETLVQKDTRARSEWSTNLTIMTGLLLVSIIISIINMVK